MKAACLRLQEQSKLLDIYRPVNREGHIKAKHNWSYLHRGEKKKKVYLFTTLTNFTRGLEKNIVELTGKAKSLAVAEACIAIIFWSTLDFKELLPGFQRPANHRTGSPQGQPAPWYVSTQQKLSSCVKLDSLQTQSEHKHSLGNPTTGRKYYTLWSSNWKPCNTHWLKPCSTGFKRGGTSQCMPSLYLRWTGTQFIQSWVT